MGSSCFCPKQWFHVYSELFFSWFNKFKLLSLTPAHWHKNKKTKQKKSKNLESGERTDEVADWKRIKPESGIQSPNKRMFEKKKNHFLTNRNAKYFMAPLHCGIFLD